jgi:hypothetical protein
MSRGRVVVRVWPVIALLGAALVALWLLLRSAQQAPLRSSRALEPELAAAPGSSSVPVERGSVATSMPPSVASASPPYARLGGVRPVTAEVERLRARVLDSLGSRQKSVAKEASDPRSAAAEPARADLVDRTGELGADALRVLSHELMPLVDECYDQARERDPDLRGMLAVNLELAGAEEVGGIIEAVEAAPDINELEDEELIECVRQSAFTIQLPEPLESGRTSKQLTMPFGDSADDHTAR